MDNLYSSCWWPGAKKHSSCWWPGAKKQHAIILIVIYVTSATTVNPSKVTRFIVTETFYISAKTINVYAFYAILNIQLTTPIQIMSSKKELPLKIEQNITYVNFINIRKFPTIASQMPFTSGNVVQNTERKKLKKNMHQFYLDFTGDKSPLNQLSIYNIKPYLHTTLDNIYHPLDVWTISVRCRLWPSFYSF